MPLMGPLGWTIMENDPDWLKKVLGHADTYGIGVTHVSIFDVIREPWPHLVHYRGTSPIYVPPDNFLSWAEHGPSDCTWIVPGTGQ